jgi:predicted Zn-dependent protease
MANQRIFRLTEEADGLMQDRRFHEALALYSELRALVPWDCYYPLQIASIYCRTGQTTRALDVLAEILEAEPGNGSALFFLAQVHVQFGNAAAAAECFRGVLACSGVDVFREVAAKFVEWFDTQPACPSILH